MKTVKTLSCVVTAVVAMWAGSAMSAQPGGANSAAVRASMSPAERGTLAHAFVKKWGPYMQQAYGVDVGTWANRMVGTFIHADPMNFKRALQRSTYEGALATLQGTGHKVTDDQVITALAQSSGPTPQPALGDVDKDLVFTPLEPCRIVDTRSTGLGAIPAGTNRGFYVWGFSSFTSQGGSATDCGGLGTQSPESVVVNVTVVNHTQNGYATFYPANAPAVPTANNMIYYPGIIISNAATVRLGVSGSSDFRIFSERTADYVVDIVGYYDAPYATALDCINNTNTTQDSAAADVSMGAAACPAGYSATGINCASSAAGGQVTIAKSFLNPLAGGTTTSGFCRFGNATGLSFTYWAYATCCRVPGR